MKTYIMGNKKYYLGDEIMQKTELNYFSNNWEKI